MPLSRLCRALALAVAAVLLLAGAASADVSGPDVSRYQHPSGGAIDWGKVRAAGHDFTFIKATEGMTVTNAYFAGDWKASAAAGLYRGAYHFARPTTTAGSAAAQAKQFAAVIGTQQQPLTLPPVLDLEVAGGLTPAALVAWTKTFLTTLKATTGRTPIIYTYPYFWKTSMGGSTAFTSYPLWIASYGTAAPPTLGWAKWTFWQYSSSGTVSGIGGAGSIDVNRFNGSMADLASLALTTAPAGGGTPTGVTDPATPALVQMSPPARYVPLTPVRFVDTRKGLGAARSVVSGALTVQVPSAVPADATGVVMNASVVSPTAAGALRAAATGTTPVTNALSFSRGLSTTGLVVTSIDATRHATFRLSGGSGHVVLDAVGYYTKAAGNGGHWVPLRPARIVDTRNGIGKAQGFQTGTVPVRLPTSVPANARGVLLNVSIVRPVSHGYVRAGAAGGLATTVISYTGGQPSTALVVTKSNARNVDVVLHGGAAHVVVDALGYYDEGSATGESLVTATPQRVLDTQRGIGARGSSIRSVTITLPKSTPVGAESALLNVTAVAPTGIGWINLSAAGTQPVTTAVNFAKAQTTTSLAVTPIGAGRQITVNVYGATTNVTIDLVGFHTR